MSLRLPAAVVFSLSLLPACAAKPAAAPPPAPARRAGAGLEVPPGRGAPYTDAELTQQFEHGRSLLLVDKHAEAAEVFDRLLRLAPDGPFAGPSLFNSGLSHEGMGEREVAAERYREHLRRFPDLPTAKGAELRLARVLAYLERWDELARVAEELLARKDLTTMEAIEAQGVKALGLVEQGEIDQAARHVGVAIDLIEKNRFGEAGKPPVELAAASFALGEVRRKRSEKILFVPLPPNFTDVLEQRCQGLLDAQAAYVEAMRSYDAHWSAMAGYRVGQLYQQLHRDVMQIPAPATADTPRRKQLFEGAMRLRYRILIEKGLKMMDATVRLGERTGEASAWIGRAREAKRDLELALEDEKAALAKLPFTEAELQAGLDSLRTKKP